MISEIDCCCGGGGVWEMGKERIFDNGILVIYTGIFFSRNYCATSYFLECV